MYQVPKAQSQQAVGMVPDRPSEDAAMMDENQPQQGPPSPSIGGTDTTSSELEPGISPQAGENDHASDISLTQHAQVPLSEYNTGTKAVVIETTTSCETKATQPTLDAGIQCRTHHVAKPFHLRDWGVELTACAVSVASLCSMISFAQLCRHFLLILNNTQPSWPC